MELRFGVKESSMQMHLAINVRISEELGGEVLWEVAHDSKLELAGDFRNKNRSNDQQTRNLTTSER